MSTYPSSTPSSEAQIQRMIDGGFIEEGHHFDAKRLFSPGKGANKEMARDLASLAINGGVLAIGIDEPDAGTFALSPQSLAGQPERIEQVAATSIDPPLYVQTTVIAAEDDADTGYIWVHVPPSGQAPHQVDGTYFGRGDKTKVRLSDAEVARHHAARSPDMTATSRALDELISLRSADDGYDRAGRLYLVAEPAIARPRIGGDYIQSTRDPAMSLLNMILAGDSNLPMDGDDRSCQPALEYLRSGKRRSSGIAIDNRQQYPELRDAGQMQVDEDYLIDVEFRLDGGVRSVIGQATGKPSEGRVGSVHDRLLTLYTRRHLAWITSFSERIAYRGLWRLGVHVDSLQFLSAASRQYASHGMTIGLPTYDQPIYRAVTTASTSEIENQAWVVAQRLLGDLMWTLGCQRYSAHLLDTPPEVIQTS